MSSFFDMCHWGTDRCIIFCCSDDDDDDDDDEPLFVPEGNLSWTAFHYKNFWQTFHSFTHVHTYKNDFKVKQFYMIL